MDLLNNLQTSLAIASKYKTTGQAFMGIFCFEQLDLHKPRASYPLLNNVPPALNKADGAALPLVHRQPCHMKGITAS